MTPSVTSGDLSKFINNYVAQYPEITDQKNLWRPPLSVTAKADRRFDILPEIAADDHALPKDLLVTGRSVVVFFIPFIKELAETIIKERSPAAAGGWHMKPLMH